jgi:hypothetical protein
MHCRAQALHVLIAIHGLARKSPVHPPPRRHAQAHHAHQLARKSPVHGDPPPRSGCVPTPSSHPSPSCVDRQTRRLTHKSPVHHLKASRLTQAASLIAPKGQAHCASTGSQVASTPTTLLRLCPSSHPSPSCMDRHTSRQSTTSRRLCPSSRPSPSCASAASLTAPKPVMREPPNASTGSQVASTPPRAGCVPRGT